MKQIFFLTFLLLCSTLTGISNEKHDKKIRQNEVLVNSFIEALNTQDLDKLTSLFKEDGTYEEVCSGRIHTGKKAISAYIAATLEGIPDSKFELVSISCSTNYAMFEWIWKGTNSVGWPAMNLPLTNKLLELRGVSVMDIENGRIRANRDYWDWNSFMKGIGAK
jgi:steroid delta-isomerase-like uncharacterized protein